jgi:hypothetical protein
LTVVAVTRNGRIPAPSSGATSASVVAEVDHIRTARRDIALRHVHNPAGGYFDQRVFHDGVRTPVEQPRRRNQHSTLQSHVHHTET